MSGLGIPGIERAEVIGRGAYGIVYRAWQPAFAREVAVKVLSVAGLDDERRERFSRECAAMGRLSEHPHIVTVYDAGFTADGAPYLIMAYLPAGSLADRIRRRGPVPWREAVAVGIKLAGALESAHRAGILHRDVKPANVLVSGFGEPQLADFGLARVTREASVTRTGALTGTPAHAAPEMLTGTGASAASDVYSLASTLHELIAGRPAFVGDGDTVYAVLQRVATEPVPDLTAHGVPAILARVLERAMAKDPGDRPRTAESFANELRAVERELGLPLTPVPVASPPPGPPPERTRAVVVPGPPGPPPAPDPGDRTVREAPSSGTGPGGGGGGPPPGSPPAPATAPPGDVPPTAVVAAARPRRHRWWVGAAVVAVIVGVAVGVVTATGGDGPRPGAPGPGVTTTAAGGGGTLEVAVLIPETGPLARFGPAARIAATDVAAAVNGTVGGPGSLPGPTLEVRILDSASDEATVRGALGPLLAGRGVDVVVGPLRNAVAEAVTGTITDAGVIHCAPRAPSVTLTRPLFTRAVPPDDVQGTALARLLVDAGGVSPVVVVAGADRASRDVASGAVAALEAAGVTVTRVDVDPTVDETADATRIAGEVGAAAPGGVIVAALVSGRGDAVVNALVGAGLGPATPPVVLSDGFHTSLAGVLDPAAAGIRGLGTYPGDPVFVDRVAARIPDGADPLFAAHVADCMDALALAAVAAGTDDPRSVWDRLDGVTTGGEPCAGFAACAELLARGADVDLVGRTGRLDLRDGTPTGGRYGTWTWDGGGGVPAIDGTVEV